jgi:hypothetical protein
VQTRPCHSLVRSPSTVRGTDIMRLCVINNYSVSKIVLRASWSLSSAVASRRIRAIRLRHCSGPPQTGILNRLSLAALHRPQQAFFSLLSLAQPQPRPLTHRSRYPPAYLTPRNRNRHYMSHFVVKCLELYVPKYYIIFTATKHNPCIRPGPPHLGLFP